VAVLQQTRLQARAEGERLFDTGEARSLDDVVSRLSQTLAVRGNAACPICGATFIRATEGDASGSGRCAGCGSSFE
jgi:hypothetical protein